MNMLVNIDLRQDFCYTCIPNTFKLAIGFTI